MYKRQGFDRSATVNAVNPGYKAYNRLVDSNFAGPDGGKFVDEYPVETVPLSGDVDKAKEYLAAAMEELGYSDVSQLPQLEPVSYTHLDVYKRQVLFCRAAPRSISRLGRRSVLRPWISGCWHTGGRSFPNRSHKYRPPIH